MLGQQILPKNRIGKREERISALRSILAELGRQPKAAKTRIVHLREGGEGIDFLGFHHRRVRGERGYNTEIPRPLALTRGDAKSPREDP